MASGSFQPRCSASSMPMVFLPSTRYGSFSVATLKNPSSSMSAASAAPASVISPATRRTTAPRARHSSTNSPGASCGMYTVAGTPARAAYAAMAPPALPAVGMASEAMPSSTARDTAMHRPRALNEPVGLSPSSLSWRLLSPTRLPMRGAASSGVPPSPSSRRNRGSRTGRMSAYRHRPPCRSLSPAPPFQLAAAASRS